MANTNENCIFCKIIQGEIPAVKIWEDKDFMAILDINPVNYGHVLLIPGKHYARMEDTPEDVVKEIFTRAKMLMKKIKAGMESDYVALSVIGLDIPHFHIHLIPRYLKDNLAHFWPTKKYGTNSMEEIAKKIMK